jgi:hypothetical protein
MEDIISQGEDRDPGRWPRWLAVLGALVLVAGGIVYLSTGRHPHSPAAAPSAPATASTGPATASTAPVSESLLGPGVPGESDGISVPAMPWAGGLLLPVAGTQPTWFSPATGRSESIGGLPTDSAGYQFTRVADGWVVQASHAGEVACGDCDVPPLPVWFLADGARSVARVGLANQVVPAAAADAVWLTTDPPASSTATPTAREVSLAGAPLGPPVRLPQGYTIDQATDRGLLLAPITPHPGTTADKLWNPADSRTVAAFDAVIAVSPAEIAWTPPCAAQCQVRLLNLATGKQTAVQLPAGSSAASGAFSPTGNYLALQVSSGDYDAQAMRLEVASVTSGRLTAMPGTLVSSDALVGFGWPIGGDNLVAEFFFATKVQLASWQPGASRLALAVIRPRQDQSSLVLG